MSSFSNGKATENGNISEYLPDVEEKLQYNRSLDSTATYNNDPYVQKQLEVNICSPDEEISEINQEPSFEDRTEKSGDQRTTCDTSSFVDDGRLSSIFVFFCLISFYIALLFAYYSSGRNSIHGDILHWIVIIIHSISMIMMMYILRKKRSWQELDFIRFSQRQSLTSDERQPLLLEDFPPPEEIKYENVSEPLVGVYVFGTLNIILSVTHIVLTGMCVPLLTRDIDTYRQGVFIMHTFFQVFFTSVQMTFFRCFKGASFKNCSFFQYAFIFTMSSNILSLMDSVGKESLAVSGIPPEYKELDWPLIDLDPANMSNKNDNIVICYDQIQTPLRTFFSSLQPFSKEYNIVCVSILLHYWMSMHPNNDRNTATRTRMVGSTYGTTTTNYNSRDQVRRRCRTRIMTAIPHDRISQRTASKINYNCCQWIALAVFILLPSVFIIGMTELYTFIQYDIFGTIQIFTLLIYKSTMIIAIVFAKNYLNKTPQQLLCKSLNRGESLLLFCLIGVYVLSCCGGVSATGKLIADIKNLTETAGINESQMNLSIARQLVLIVLTIINIVQTSLQTILILKIRRTKSVDNDAKVIIHRCFLYLMIANATIWLSNIVVSPDSKTCFFDTYYFMFGDTMVIVNIIFRPLTAYYLFTSVVLLYQASKCLKN